MECEAQKRRTSSGSPGIRRYCCSMRTIAAVVLGLACAAASAHAQADGALNTITLPRAPESTVSVRPLLPSWVAMPTTARILTSEGLAMRPLRNSAVTWENAKLGILVGALTNAGPCARTVRAFLQYTDHRWQAHGRADRERGTGQPGAIRAASCHTASG